MSCLCGYSECTGCIWGAGGLPPGLTSYDHQPADKVVDRANVVHLHVKSNSRPGQTPPPDLAVDERPANVVFAAAMLSDIRNSIYEIAGIFREGYRPDIPTTLEMLGVLCERVELELK